MRVCTLNPCTIHKTLLNDGYSPDYRGRKVLDTVFCQNNPGSTMRQTVVVGRVERFFVNIILWLKKVWKWMIYK